jgi:hypothetical protein
MFWNKNWKELISWMVKQEKINKDQQKQIDLILKEINKEYVPETEKKEPAKLVEKSIITMNPDWGIISGGSTDTSYPEYKPKKKVERPKKKK